MAKHPYTEHEPTGPRLGVSCADCTTKTPSSNIGLEIRFDATENTPRFSAQDIANFVATEMAQALKLENVKVEAHGSFLNYAKPYRAEKARAALGAKDGLN